MRSSIVFAAVVAWGLAEAAIAQNKVEIIEFSGTGKLVGVAPGTMVFVTPQGQRLQARFAKPGEMSVTLKTPKGPPLPIVAGPPTVDITGELSPEQIRPGLTVVLNCVLDANQKNVKPVAEVKVLDTKPENAGVHADGAPNDQGQPVLIKGIAKSFKGGELTISVPKGNSAPKGTIAVSVADDVKVTFESHNLAMAAAGSEVKVEGIQAGKGGEIAANTITVKLPAPAPRTGKKRPGKAPPNAPQEEPKAGEPKPDAAKPDAKKPDATKPGEAPAEEPKPADPKPAGPKPDGPKKRTKPGKVVPLIFGH